MKFILATASAVALACGTNAVAQVGNPATPRVGQPMSSSQIGPPAPVIIRPAEPRRTPLPSSLTLDQAIEEAAARSPTVVASDAELQAAEARLRQAGYRDNPDLSLEIENVAGTGALRGIRSMETTLAVNQRLDLAGRRSSRVGTARAAYVVQKVRTRLARADLAQTVREQFARALAAREKLAQAEDTLARARELARVATVLVDAGRDPPLRGLRARSALAQAEAEREGAAADELAARSSLAATLGASSPVEAVTGPSLYDVATVSAETALDVQLARAERRLAEAEIAEQTALARLDPAVGVGVRHVRETGDVGLVAGVSMPLKIFDRSQGNIAAARANLTAADARQASALATAEARLRNAVINREAAQRRVEALEKSAIPEAAEAMRLAELSYREGRTSLLELIDAQTAFTASRSALTDARLALALAVAELGRLTAQ